MDYSACTIRGYARTGTYSEINLQELGGEMMKEEAIILNPPKKRRQTGKRKNLNLILFVLIFLVLIVAIPYYFLVPKEETYKLQQFDYAQISMRDFVITVPAEGKVVASKKVTVVAPAAGEVLKVYCKPGDMVRSGDLLMELESEKLKEDYVEAQAQYQKKITERATLLLEHDQKMKEMNLQIRDREQTLQKLKNDISTWKKLYELGDISLVQYEAEQKKIEDATRALEESKETKQYLLRKHQISLDDTEAIIADSQKSMNEIKEAMEENKVRAEIGGKVIAIPAKVGSTVQVGATVAEIIDEQSLLVEGQVALTAVEDVKVGQPVAIQASGRTFKGTVSYISPVAKESTVPVQIEFDQVPENLRAEGVVSLEIETGVLEDQMALPRGRYLASGQERYVFVVNGKQAERKEVTFGLINGNYIQVKAGLQEGDRVITSSYDNFSHLSKIEINPEGGYEHD